MSSRATSCASATIPKMPRGRMPMRCSSIPNRRRCSTSWAASGSNWVTGQPPNSCCNRRSRSIARSIWRARTSSPCTSSRICLPPHARCWTKHCRCRGLRTTPGIARKRRWPFSMSTTRLAPIIARAVVAGDDALLAEAVTRIRAFRSGARRRQARSIRRLAQKAAGPVPERGNGRFVRGLPTWDGLAGIRSPFRAASRRQPGGHTGQAAHCSAREGGSRRRSARGRAEAAGVHARDRTATHPAAGRGYACGARSPAALLACGDQRRRRFLRGSGQALRQLCQHQSDGRAHPAGGRCGHLAAIVVGASAGVRNPDRGAPRCCTSPSSTCTDFATAMAAWRDS